MDHIAIDLGSRESQICIRTADGALVEEHRLPTMSLPAFLNKRSPGARVILESCAEAFAVADAARAAGHDPVVVPASLAPSLGVGHRGIKTDSRDGRNLSEASCRMSRLPSVHVPTQQSRERKAMCASREGLIEVRTKLINTSRGWMRSQGLGVIRSGSPTTLPHRLREHVRAKKHDLPPHIERVLLTIEQLTLQIVAADAELEAAAAADPTCQLLMTAPGVGPLTAVRFAAAIDAVERFPNAHELESYLGLTPGESSSSDRKRRTGLTKAGSTRVRWALIQASWAARRFYKEDPLIQWSQVVEKRRGKNVAVTALARRLAGVLYAMWRDKAPYDQNYRPRTEPTPVMPAAPAST